MPTATRPPRAVPSQEARWIDPLTGRPTPEFFEYIKLIDALVRALRLEMP